jgi:hypothetical protein
MMYANAGVVFTAWRSRASRESTTSFLAHAEPAVSDWKYTNGLRQVMYGSSSVGA